MHLGNGISPIIKAVRMAAASVSKDKMNHIIRKLVQKDPTVLQTRIEGKNLLYVSWSTSPDLKQIELLLDLGFPVNMTNTCAVSIQGQTRFLRIRDFSMRVFSMLFFAVARRNNELMNLLIQRGANPNVHGYVDMENGSQPQLVSLLYYSMDYGYNEDEEHMLTTMETLLNAGADVDAKDERGRTCLYHAVRERLCATTKDLLLQFGANVNAHCNMQYGGLTPMDIASAAQAAHIAGVLQQRRLRVWLQMKKRDIPREIAENYLMPPL